MTSQNWYIKEKQGWYELVISHRDFPSLSNLLDHYELIVDWIGNNIDNPDRHARWKIDAETLNLVFRFRYERDYISFVLKWK